MEEIKKMSMFKDIPVDVGVIYEGERIRRNDMQVEFGGPSVKQKFELAKVKPMDEIEDGKITIIGPDIKDMKEGGAYPLGILVEAAGATLDQGLEGVIERRIHGYLNYIEGFMHLNQRYDIWIRLGKKSFQKGLNSFEPIGKVLYRLFKSELPIIEKVQITFITDPAKLSELYPKQCKITNHAMLKQEVSKTKMSTNFTVAPCANHLLQPMFASSPRKDTLTAEPSAGLTEKPQQTLILKDQYSQSTEAN